MAERKEVRNSLDRSPFRSVAKRCIAIKAEEEEKGREDEAKEEPPIPHILLHPPPLMLRLKPKKNIPK